MSSRGIKRYVEQVLEAEGVKVYTIAFTRNCHHELRFDHRGTSCRVVVVREHARHDPASHARRREGHCSSST